MVLTPSSKCFKIKYIITLDSSEGSDTIECNLNDLNEDSDQDDVNDELDLSLVCKIQISLFISFYSTVYVITYFYAHPYMITKN